MGRHEAPHPEHHILPSKGSPGSRRLAIAGLLVVAAAAVVAVPVALISQEGDRADAQDSSRRCASRPSVSIAAAEQIVPVVRAAAARAADAGTCATFQVSGVAPAAEAATILSGAAPEVWVPDSSVWVDQLNSAGPARAWVPRASVASSPVVLAMPPAVASQFGGTAPRWSRLLTGTVPLQIANPDTDSTGRLALFASSAALGSSATARKIVGGAMIQLSRTTAPTEAELFRRYTEDPDKAAAFAASEQAVAAFNRDHPETPLSALVPAEGTHALDFPWVAAPGLDSQRLESTNAVLRELSSPRGTEDLERAGLRSAQGDNQPAVEGVPQGAVQSPPDLSPEARVSTLALWASVRTEMRMIAVIDVSGSMKQQAGPRSRIELAQGAAMTALATFPPASKVGLWEFSTNRGKAGQDWQALAPIRPLSAKVGEKTQRQVLTERLATLPGTVAGDTGLHDTLLAAFRAVKKGYDPDRINSVVLLTDGINDDPSGITLDKLVAALKAEQSPERPVRVILVGMGPETDAEALETIAKAAGGASYVAKDPRDITTVFVQALLSRG